MITLKNVTKELEKKIVLNEINLFLEQGRIYLVEGHNGCGKTMLLRIICGLMKPTSGEVYYDEPINFGVIIENPSFIESESGLWNLQFLAKIKHSVNTERIEKAMRMFGLQEYGKQKVKRYSLGIKQRLAICQAVMEDQRVILLDEPFNALDEESCYNVVRIINELKEEGKTVVIAAHNIKFRNELEIDQTIQMSNGSILSYS